MSDLTVRENQQVVIEDRIAGALKYATFLFKAGMAPECFKSPEALAVTMLRGAELGLTYSDSVTSLYVVKGAVAPYTKTVVYMFERRGGKVELLEWDADHAKIRLTQRGRAPLVVQFTLAECKQAGWNMEPGKDGQGMKEKHTWSRMPKIMVLNRTVTNGIKAYSPTSQFARTFDPDVVDEADDELEALDDSIEGQMTEIDMGNAEPQHEDSDAQSIQQPTPGAGYDTWPLPKQRRFWKHMGDHGLGNGDDVHHELGVKSMHEWLYSSEQTRPILEALEYQETISLAEKKIAMGVGTLAEIVWYGMTFTECKEAIDALVASKTNEPVDAGPTQEPQVEDGKLL